MVIDPQIADVILRDGSTLRLRPPREADASAVLELFRGLSPESLHLRFHGLPGVTPALVGPLMKSDWDERGALIGTLDAEGGERVVALASYARLRDPTAAEVSFAVADDLQGRGIGMRLLEQLADIAPRYGIERFVARVLPENRHMLSVFTDAGFDVREDSTKGLLSSSFRCPRLRSTAPTSTKGLTLRWSPRSSLSSSLRAWSSWALPLAPGRSAAACSATSSTGGFARSSLSREPRGRACRGSRGRTTAIDRDPRPRRPRRRLPSRRARPRQLQSGAPTRDARALRHLGGLRRDRSGRSRASGAAPGTRPKPRRSADRPELPWHRELPDRASTPRSLPAPFPPGSIGFSSQSGALGLALLEQAKAGASGFSSFVSIGNKADVSSNDLLEYWEDDPATAVVLLYLESFGNPRTLRPASRGESRVRKPILAMKSG